MEFTDHNREYRLVRESDLERGGMAMKLIAVRENKPVAKVVYSESNGEFTISIFEPDLPLTVVEQLIGSAKIALVPATTLHERSM